MKKIINKAIDVFALPKGTYFLSTYVDGNSGAAGFFVNPDGTVNTFHQFPGWTSVDEYSADEKELERQLPFPGTYETN